MKLTESQLAELFQNNSKRYTSSCDATDCLMASEASSSRLSHLEDLISDHETSQAMKVSLGLKDWSQVMAQSIENSKQSWFNFLGMSTPLKTAFATVTFAFVFAVALPEINRFNQQPIHTPVLQDHITQDDVISHNRFDDNNDILSSDSFDGSNNQDDLFNASFG